MMDSSGSKVVIEECTSCGKSRGAERLDTSCASYCRTVPCTAREATLPPWRLFNDWQPRQVEGMRWRARSECSAAESTASQLSKDMIFLFSIQSLAGRLRVRPLIDPTQWRCGRSFATRNGSAVGKSSYWCSSNGSRQV